MPYASTLEARIAKQTTQAIVDHGLIVDGDRILVGLSGGKDSWALLQILDVLRRRAPIDFSLVAVHVDAGSGGADGEVIAEACERRGWDCRIERTSINSVLAGVLEPGALPCPLCARLRRGVLYRVAGEVGATRIALGHHADDVIETLLLNLFFEGAMKAMPARLVSDDGLNVVIRPFVYVSEQETAAYTRWAGLPVLPAGCAACGEFDLKRRRIKQLLLDLEGQYPGLKYSMRRAVGNVVPSHLLDLRLNPNPELGAAALERGEPSAGPERTSRERRQTAADRAERPRGARASGRRRDS